MTSTVELLTLVGILAAIVSSATEWAKNILATSHFDDTWSEEAHAALVQAFALGVGAFVGYVAQLDVVHVLLPSSTLPLTACYLLSGLALALPADALKTVLGWFKAARDAKEKHATPPALIGISGEPPQTWSGGSITNEQTLHAARGDWQS